MNDPSTGHQRNINGTSMVGVSSLGVKIWKKKTPRMSQDGTLTQPRLGFRVKSIRLGPVTIYLSRRSAYDAQVS